MPNPIISVARAYCLSLDRILFEKHTLKQYIHMYTPYSMNSLFSELFGSFGGACLEVCGAIQGSRFRYLGVGLLAKAN